MRWASAAAVQLLLQLSVSTATPPPPPVVCDPTAKPAQTCPGGKPCPPCGNKLKAACDCPAAAAAPPPPPRVAKWYELDTGVCLNGDKGGIFAYHEPADKGTSSDWVIELGGPPEMNFCVSEAHCKVFGTPSKPGSSCGSGNTSLCPVNTTFLGFGGPFSTNCTDNPDFCGFNYARLDPACAFDLFLGDNLYSNASSFNYSLHFDGKTVLAAAIAKLGTLGLAKAKQVLLTGVSWGGTAVFLNADRVQALIRKLNPGLKKFKALPVDGLHPKQVSAHPSLF